MADLRWQLKPIAIKNASVLFERLEADLNTPQVLSFIDDILGDTPFTNFENAPPQDFLEQIRDVLGIDLLKPDVTDEQKAALVQRQTARDDKDWAKSDQLREQLAEQGIGINDTIAVQIWYRL